MVLSSLKTEIRISCNSECKKFGGNYRNGYVAKSGTSMATPIVSGAMSLLYGSKPELSNEEGKRKLLYSAIDLGEPWYKQGYGMVNIQKLLM